MFVNFFIQRPVFATVCSLLIVLGGAIAIPTLPVAQYPLLASPQVTVQAFYTGASAQVVESAVTIPIEQTVNGVEGMKYIQSWSGNDGSSTITITFEVARDIDLAIVDVQNRVSQALGRLPNEVKAAGVTVSKNSTAMVFAGAMWCEHGEYSSQFISNYLDVFVKDAIKRVHGVGKVDIFGERKYAMRLWLDPLRLAGRKLTASDVVRALREQNVQVAAGQVGQEPARPDQPYQISVRAIGRLSDPGEFERMILKTGADGTLVLLEDVGRAELGSEDYSTVVRFNGREAVGFGVMQLPSANALDVDREARAVLNELAKKFPPGLKYGVAFDPTTTVRESIREVLVTMAEAIALVIAVIFIFLQSWRPTLIPAVTIPVSLIGTFIFVKVFGFSINTLTLFGLTLATGLVVDDAIVVIENIERHNADKKRPVRTAAARAMVEVTGAVIATSLVLVAVFVPVALFPGTAGRLYKQFSLTIAFSVALSAFNALTLTPALSVLLLRTDGHAPGRIFGVVNRIIEGITVSYQRSLARVLRHPTAGVAVFAVGLVATGLLAAHVPTGFVPDEDQGYFIINVQAPPGGSLESTLITTQRVEAVLSDVPEVSDVFNVNGHSFIGDGGNKAMIFVNLKPTAERHGEAHGVAAVVERVRPRLATITAAIVTPFLPPTIQGVGDVGGFQFQLEDRGGNDIATLATATRKLVDEANKERALTGIFAGFTADDPQMLVLIDREKAKSLDISFDQIADTLQVYMGAAYVNDFDFNNRSYRVYIQADMDFRSQPQDIQQFYVRSNGGHMVPLDTVAHLTDATAPQTISHYNLFRSSEINGAPSPGFSTGESLAAMEAAAKRAMPLGLSYEWTGLSLEQIESGSQSLLIFALGLLFVYLVLAAQYESFVLPLIILFAVPLSILGALGAQVLRGLSNDVFCQIGLVMLIGLSSKNAILIVEFAEQVRQRGRPTADAALESAGIRLRPIVMTSLAFVLGVVPLVFASGAGAEARHSLGTAVFGGMIVSTLLNLYFIPVLYVFVDVLRRRSGAMRHA